MSRPQLLTIPGSGGSGGTPGGSDTQLQYNNSGAFGGITGATTDGTTLTLVSPALGAATATSINKVALTAPATGSTLTIADGKTLTASNTLTLAGTDSSTLNIGAGGTLGTAAFKAIGTSGNNIPLLDGANTWSAAQTFGSGDLKLSGSSSGTAILNAPATGAGTLTLPAGSDTLAGLAAANAFTSKNTFPAIGLTADYSASGIFGTAGAFIQSSGTLTDTTSSGTVATAYGGLLGNHTWAASSATTITNVFGQYVSAPTAGTNVTFTNQYGLGSDSLYSAGNITLGGVVTSTHVGDATWTLGDSGSTVSLSVGALELVTGRMKVTASTLNLSSDWNILYNSDTMLSRSAAGVLRIGKTNDTATGQLQVASIQTNGVIYSAAGTPLPTAASGFEGMRASVSDATAPVYGAAYTSGGTVHAPVYCDGTNWVHY